MKHIWIVVAVIFQLICWSACSKADGDIKPAPELKSSIPENNAVDVNISTEIEIVFDEVISLANNHGITINNAPANVQASFTKLIFTELLEGNTSYLITIPKGAVINSFDVPLETDIKLTFTTKEVYVPNSDALAFVANMGVGWNLGNTLDTKNEDETKWGNPLATKELIDAVREKGFKTLRVPVTWQYHMGPAPDYIIEKVWLERVEEVVNYGLDNDMYVIVNIHHDEEWLIPTYAELDRAKDQLSKVWAQIANQLKDYDEHLIFETFNETRLKGSSEEWKGGTAEGRDCINQFHDAAIKAIRATGQNNSTRYIMISPYAASSSPIAINNLVFPADENLLASVHNYFPYKFALAQDDFNTSWGTIEEKEALDAEFDRLVETFTSKGIPVVMGEWGNLNHNNLQERIKHAEYYAKGCTSRGICPIWWDNGNSEHFGIISRDSHQWVFPGIADVIVGASQN